MAILNNRTLSALRWVARIWSLPAILFTAGEIIAPHGGNTPEPFITWLTLGLQFTAVLGLAAAWRWETIGGSLSLATMLASLVLFIIDRGAVPWQAGLIWAGFIIAPAALFLYLGLRGHTTTTRTP